MNCRIIKQANTDFTRRFPVTMPTMGWYFTSTVPDNAITMPPDTWTCMFKHLEDVVKGRAICFSKGAAGCAGASCYFGFTQPSEKAGSFLGTKEKFKQNADLGKAFYRQIQAGNPEDTCLVWGNIEHMTDDIRIEVVNYWVNPLSLTGLVTLANFDSPENDNVTIPFASGCQSMWTMPYKESDNAHPRATVGALDPAMRKYIPADTVLFSVPANRFCSMAKTIEESFACENSWTDLIQKKVRP